MFGNTEEHHVRLNVADVEKSLRAIGSAADAAAADAASLNLDTIFDGNQKAVKQFKQSIVGMGLEIDRTAASIRGSLRGVGAELTDHNKIAGTISRIRALSEQYDRLARAASAYGAASDKGMALPAGVPVMAAATNPSRYAGRVSRSAASYQPDVIPSIGRESFGKAAWGGTPEMPDFMKSSISGLKSIPSLAKKASGAILGGFNAASFAVWKLDQGFTMVVNGLRSVGEVAREGEGIKNVEMAFESTAAAAGISMERLRKATRNSVSDNELRKMAVFASQSKITSDNIVQFAEAAVGANMKTGMSIQESFQRYVKGVSKQEKEIIDETTTHVDNAAKVWRDYAKEKGIALGAMTAADKQAAYQESVAKAAQSNVDFGRENRGAVDLANAATKIENAFDKAKVKITEAVVELGLIDGALNLVDNTLSMASSSEFSVFFELIADTATEALVAVVDMGKAVAPALLIVIPAVKSLASGFGALAPLVRNSVIIIVKFAQKVLPILWDAVGGTVRILGELAEFIPGVDSSIKDLGTSIQKGADDIRKMEGELDQMIASMSDADEKTNSAAAGFSAFNTAISEADYNALQATKKMKGLVRMVELLGLKGVKAGTSLGELKRQLKDILALGTQDFSKDVTVDTSTLAGAAKARAKLEADIKQTEAKLAAAKRGESLYKMRIGDGEKRSDVTRDEAIAELERRGIPEGYSIEQMLSAQEKTYSKPLVGDSKGNVRDLTLQLKLQQDTLADANRRVDSALDEANRFDNQASALQSTAKDTVGKFEGWHGHQAKITDVLQQANEKGSVILDNLTGFYSYSQSADGSLDFSKMSPAEIAPETLNPEKFESVIDTLTTDTRTGDFDAGKTKKNYEVVARGVYDMNHLLETQINPELRRHQQLLQEATDAGDQAKINDARKSLAAAEASQRAIATEMHRMIITRDRLEFEMSNGAKKKKGGKGPRMILHELLATSEDAMAEVQAGAVFADRPDVDFAPRLMSKETDVVMRGNLDDIENHKAKIKQLQNEYIETADALTGLMQGAETIREFEAYAEQYVALKRSTDAIREWFPDKSKVTQITKKGDEYLKWQSGQVEQVKRIIDGTRELRRKTSEVRQEIAAIAAATAEQEGFVGAAYMNRDFIWGTDDRMKEVSRRDQYQNAASELPKWMLAEAFGQEYQAKLKEYSAAERLIVERARDEAQKLKETLAKNRLTEGGVTPQDEQAVQERLTELERNAQAEIDKIAAERAAFENDARNKAIQKWSVEKQRALEQAGTDMGQAAGTTAGFGFGDALVRALNDAYHETEDWVDMMGSLMGDLLANLGMALGEWAKAEIMLATGNPIGAAVASAAIVGFAQALGGLFTRKKSNSDVERVAERELKRKRERKDERFTITLVNNGLAVTQQQVREIGRVIAMKRKYKVAA